MSGLLAPQAEITIEIAQQEGESMISAEENAKTRTFLMENWNLGPDRTNQPNTDYWRTLSKVWRISPEQAKRNLCANCEYFNDSPDMVAKMESVPEDRFDKDGLSNSKRPAVELVSAADCHSSKETSGILRQEKAM